MFSFIKFLQSLLSRLKKNKGLWFTVLSVSSIMGILISMTLINTMTSDVTHKTYMKVHRVDTTQLANILDNRYSSLLAIAGVISINPDLILNIKSKSDKSTNDLLAKAEKGINDRVDSDPIDIHYYAKAYKTSGAENTKYAKLVLETGRSVTGIVVDSTGARLVAITDVKDNNTTIGAIEVSQDISVLRDSFERAGKEFAFLLDKAQLMFINLESKQGMTQDINDQYKIFFHNYSPQFYMNAKKLDLKRLQQEKFAIDSLYYTTYDEAIDIDGKPIGLFLIGESAKDSTSFVNITKNLVSSITTVALGLVISLILFMF